MVKSLLHKNSHQVYHIILNSSYATKPPLQDNSPPIASNIVFTTRKQFWAAVMMEHSLFCELDGADFYKSKASVQGSK